MYFWLVLALVFAVLEVVAVSKNSQRLEYIAKPAVMVFLFLWLYAATGMQGNAFWFALGILFSLAGDVLFLFPDGRLFTIGLGAFLTAHICYITGLREQLIDVTAWSLILLVFIAINVSRLIRRIVRAMHAKGQARLSIPVSIYGTVISVMLYAALSTIYAPAWGTSAAFFISTGAFLFCVSDLILAWNKFVTPVKNGPAWIMALYHLGQIGIVAGVISQFG